MPLLECGHSVHDMHQPHYCTYLHLEELTALQPPVAALRHHDELLFIIVHQATELWFKLILHEIAQISSLIVADRPGSAIWLLRRIEAVLRLLAEQLMVLSTMAPQDFYSFRGAASSGPASDWEPLWGRRSHVVMFALLGRGCELSTRSNPPGLPSPGTACHCLCAVAYPHLASLSR